ncbi:MAG: M48 family metallopeptidase [Pseudomonadota bacterium]
MVSDPSDAHIGYYNDGQTAASHEVEVRFGPNGLVFGPPDNAAQNHWSYDGLEPVRPVSASGPSRLRYEGAPEARLIIASPKFARQVVQRAPQVGTRAGHKATAKIAFLCIAGVAAFAVASWLVLSAAPATVAAMIPQSWWGYMGEKIETSLVKSAKRCGAPEGKKALARMAFRFSDDIEANSVRVYDMPIVNAFAMAGGRVVLTSGLIAAANSADEVAGVLAHELGHVKAHHPEEQLVRVFGLQLILSALWGGSGMTDALAQGSALLAVLRYTRSAEGEADAIAIELLQKAKIDPRGLAAFFRTLQKTLGGDAGSSASQVTNLLRTHPGLAERIDQIGKLQVGPTTPSLSDDDWQHLKNICSES